jgi:hypothetical protein
MTDGEFEARMVSLRVGLDRFDRMMEEILEPGVDLMTIEGVEKKILTLSGAEKTCFVARLVPSFVIERRTSTSENEPAIHYTVRCNLHLGNLDGPVVAQGVGSCNSHEKKYRWRYAEKFCPSCGVVGSVVKSKFKDDRGEFSGSKPFFCWNKKGGCGAKFAEDDVRITGQKMGMVENPDPCDLDNTLLKMGKKRAFVDATKTATASSGRVTVDLEEGEAGSDEAVKLRDEVMSRAAKAGWTKLGEVLDLARRATGKPVRLKVDFDKLKASDFAKMIRMMPEPAPEKGDDEQSLGTKNSEASDGN